jgi:hypothetical protein
MRGAEHETGTVAPPLPPMPPRMSLFKGAQQHGSQATCAAAAGVLGPTGQDSQWELPTVPARPPRAASARSQRMSAAADLRRKWETARSLACSQLALNGVEDLQVGNRAGGALWKPFDGGMGIQHVPLDAPQDFLASLILSECAYKKLELSHADLAETIAQGCNMFPQGWVNLESVQASLGDIPQQ